MKFKTSSRDCAGQAKRRGNAHRRGTVIVLVVAVLALLTVIGTVYVISARSEKSSAAAAATNVNLNWARDAVMNSVTQIIGDWNIDANGKVGGYSTTGTYGARAARNYDYPEPGAVGSYYAAAGTNNLMRSQPWLVANLHVRPGNPAGDFSTGLGDISRLSENFFDPSTGSYSLGLASFVAGNKINVVYDRTASDQKDNSGVTVGGSDAAQPDSFGAVIDPANYPDSYVYLLPFSDASGIRYRYGIRIMDTSAKANLNAGATDDALAVADSVGKYITSLRLAPSATDVPDTAAAPSCYFNAVGDTAALLHSNPALLAPPNGIGRAGGSGAAAAFVPATWQPQMLRIERPSDLAISLFDLSDELELRSYGQFGTPYHCRPATGTSLAYRTWPATLSANPLSPTSSVVTGNPRRRNYTAFSFSRDLYPFPEPPPNATSTDQVKFTLTPVSGASTFGYTPTTIWPPMPARVAANAEIGALTSDQDAAYNLALTATNLATAMRYTTYAGTFAEPGQVPFTQSELGCFVANYITMRWNGMQKDPNITTVDALYLPNGPSYVDETGICVRSADTSQVKKNRDFGAGMDVRAEAGKVYLGYSAQPFINEVAARLHKEPVPNSDPPQEMPVVDDTGIELFNPYPVALSLRDYHLKVNGQDIPIGQQGEYIPAYGYFVIRASTSLPATASTTVVLGADNPNVQLSPNGGKVQLLRTYYDRTANPKLAVVDEFEYSALMDLNGLGPTSPGDDFTLQRTNANDPTQWPWSGTVQVSYPRDDDPTLGTVNGTHRGQIGSPLYDRFAATAPATQGSPFDNVPDFNRTMRISNTVDATSGDPTAPLGCISQQIASLQPTTPPYDQMLLPIEAQIHFDFLAGGWFYGTIPPSAMPINPGGMKGGDIRAVRLLEQLAFIDRVSDQSIDIGTGSHDVGKLRLPGRINLNTAVGVVIRSLPGIQASADPNKAVAKILAYRIRNSPGQGATTGYTYPPNGSASASFNNQDAPGRGFRSMSEVLAALADTTATTLDARDTDWGRIYNLCTVRSDTFVVYGYIEAIKANPRLVAGGLIAVHNNSTDWYDVASTSDEVNYVGVAAPAKNIRLSRLRWVAIVDRSWCNYPVTDSKFQLPKVAAIKDLPK